MRGQAIKNGEPIIGDADKWLNLIHVEDGAAIVAAAGERAAPGSLYNVSDGVPVRRRDFYTTLAERLNAPRPHFVPLEPGAAVPPHEKGQRRIVNKKMIAELQISFQYPSYEVGLTSDPEA